MAVGRDEVYEREILTHLPGTVSVYTAACDSTPLERDVDYANRIYWRAPYAASKLTAPQVHKLLQDWIPQCRFDVAVGDFLPVP